MKTCPTSNMNKSSLWGFDVSHIIISFVGLACSNVVFNIVNIPLVLSWLVGILLLVSMRVISHGQKNGHLELLSKFVFSPRIYLGHKGRKGGACGE